MLTLIENGRIFDGESEALIEGAPIVVEDERIVSVGEATSRPDQRIDLAGRVIMPGLIDAHVHVYAADVDLTRNMRRPFTYLAHHAARFLRHMLHTGFTTVRDTGGADHGLARAWADGLFEGARPMFGGRILSQTGGHADWRPGHEHDPSAAPCGCGAIDQRLAVIADGVEEVVKATREELRRGASHIKIVASGGVASPTDPLDALQYSPEEIGAIVAEAQRHGSYVAAHCHPKGAILACIEAGVRSIEHGTFLDAESADVVARAGAFVVPTLAVIDGLAERGAELGLPPVSQQKLREIADVASRGVEAARDAGVMIGFGTDLLGSLYTRNLREFALRRSMFRPVDILRQATSVNARLLRREHELGCIRPGALADLVAVEGEPLEDISVLEKGPSAMPLVMQAGRIVRWHA